MNRKWLYVTMLFTMVAFAGCNNPDKTYVTIDVDTDAKGIEISPTLYGLFFEEINHAGDGGLYAELISNRSFEDDGTFRPGEKAATDENGKPVIFNWSLEADKDCKANLSLEKSPLRQLNKVQKNALKIEMPTMPDGGHVTIMNDGYWGINAVNGREYTLTLWACAAGKYQGGIQVGLMGKDAKEYATATLADEISTRWQKYSVKFKSTVDDPEARFFITFDKPGTIYLDMVSLFPPTFKGRENGLRIDLAEKLEAIHPKFIRFPGGCFVEGESKESSFNWSTTIAPIEERPGHMNYTWGYRCTDGFGYHEMLQLCEDLNAAPLFVINVGIWHNGYHPYNQIEEYIESAINAIEYANGDTNTKYGAMRAANGHPAPFNLKYLEIGNENYQYDTEYLGNQSNHYPERYIQFYKSIHEKYPYIEFIGNVEAWGTDTPSWRNEHPVDLLDEHYYRTPAWFANNFHKYDSYNRKGAKIYTGEYAVTSDCGEGNMNAAIGEAIFMMGMENNSDVVSMCSYAPIFVNWNDRRWMPDMIRLTSAQSYGSPSYWIQQMFSTNVGTHIVKSELEAPKIAKKPNFGVGVGSWLSSVEYKDAAITVNGTVTAIPFDGQWQKGKGIWSISNDGLYSQSSLDEGCTSVYLKNPVTSPKYSFSVKARKNGGSEGFLVLFNARDADNYYWFNIGGWSNKTHAVESVSGSGKITVTSTDGSIEDDVWYDIRIDVDNNNVQCYLNDELICRFTITEHDQVFANAQIDEKSNEVIVKVVNFSEYEHMATINLSGKDLNAGTATKTTLCSMDGRDENTFEAPDRIVPQTEMVTVNGNKVKFTLSPYSVNIVRVKNQ